MPIFWHTTTPAHSCKDEKSGPHRKGTGRFSIHSFSSYTRTISGVISARECAPHICMVSASSPASLSM